MAKGHTPRKTQAAKQPSKPSPAHVPVHAEQAKSQSETKERDAVEPVTKTNEKAAETANTDRSQTNKQNPDESIARSTKALAWYAALQLATSAIAAGLLLWYTWLTRETLNIATRSEEPLLYVTTIDANLRPESGGMIRITPFINIQNLGKSPAILKGIYVRNGTAQPSDNEPADRFWQGRDAVSTPIMPGENFSWHSFTDRFQPAFYTSLKAGQKEFFISGKIEWDDATGGSWVATFCQRYNAERSAIAGTPVFSYFPAGNEIRKLHD